MGALGTTSTTHDTRAHVCSDHVHATDYLDDHDYLKFGRGVADPHALPRLLLQRSFLDDAPLAKVPNLEEPEKEVVEGEVEAEPEPEPEPEHEPEVPAEEEPLKKNSLRNPKSPPRTKQRLRRGSTRFPCSTRRPPPR